MRKIRTTVTNNCNKQASFETEVATQTREATLIEILDFFTTDMEHVYADDEFHELGIIW